MWYCLTLFLLVGAVVADHPDRTLGWQSNQQYRYLVRSRTLTGLDQLSNQFTGVLIKAILDVQAVTPNTLQATLSNPQYARVHKALLEGPESEISDQQLQFLDLPLSGKPFEIRLKHGVVRDLLVDRNVATWELNLLKSIVSQFQADTQGENVIIERGTQPPNDEQQPFATYKTMEDSVGGKCEVLYDITPLSHSERNVPGLVPLPELDENGHLIDVRKTKNYNKCQQQRGYHHTNSGRATMKQGSNDNDAVTMKSSTSRIILSGNLKSYTIQSSVTTNNILVKPEIQNSVVGTVHSKMNLTLVKRGEIITPVDLTPSNLVSTGNLVFTYNSPLTDIEQGNKHHPSLSRNSKERRNSGSQSSSEENQGGSGKGSGRGRGSGGNSRGNGGNSRGSGGNSSGSSSSDSSSSSSSSSSSEEFEYVQPVQGLDEASDNSLLPFFFGENQNSQKSGNVVETAYNQILQIVAELRDSSKPIMQHGDTLEKFTIFINQLRSMQSKQIGELEQRVEQQTPFGKGGAVPPRFAQKYQESQNSGDSTELNSWVVLRDGVGQAGTGPALITIVNWVKEEKLSNLQAARIISKIPIVARLPTKQYVQLFFELITDAKVTTNELLRSIAPVAFSELVHKAQVNKKHSQKTYPIYTFGKIFDGDDKDVCETYIPHFKQQLQQAISEKDSPQAQAWIVALGNLGHPKILSVFEPYLEGQVPVSTYQRTLMVSSLRTLVKTQPRRVAAVLYKIYLNEREAEEVRVAAVQLYLLSNPSLVTLLRMAKHTNFEKNDQVNSAVQSGIENLARTNRLDLQDVSHKARVARKLLTPKRFNLKYSHSRYTNNFVLETIGSGDSNIPKALHIDAYVKHINHPVAQINNAVSNVRQFLRLFTKQAKNMKTSQVEHIANELNMQIMKQEKLEGNVHISSIYGEQFYPYEEQTIERVRKWLRKTLQNTNIVDSNKLDSYDETVSFPTETGLSFAYTLEMPSYSKVHVTQDNADESMKTTNNVEKSGKINTLIAHKLQSKHGFTTPFDNQQYVTSIDRKLTVNLPLQYQLEVQTAKNSWSSRVTVRPTRESRKIELLKYGTSTFTSRNDQDQPLSLSKNTYLIDDEPKQKQSFEIGTLHINAEINKWSSHKKEFMEHQIKNVWKLSSSPLTKLNKLEVLWNVDNVNNDFHLNIDYDHVKVDNVQDNNSQRSKEPIPIEDKKPNSANRRKQVVEELTRGFTSANVHVVDISVDIPTILKEERQVLTIGAASSEIDQKTRGLAYWNTQSAESTNDVHLEALATAEVRTSLDSLLNLEEALQYMPQDEMEAEIRIGKNYRMGDKIQLHGNFMRSDNLKERILNSEVVQKCLQDKELRACQKAIQMALTKDHFMMSMNMDSNVHTAIANMALNYIIGAFPNAKVDFINPKNAGTNTIDIMIKTGAPGSKYFGIENSEFFINTPEMDIVYPSANSKEELIPLNWENSQENECTMDGKQVVTFDKKTYDMQTGSTWHVMMIPVNAGDLEDLKIPNDMKVAVMARQTANNVQILMQLINGSKRMAILMTNQNNHVIAVIEGSKVQLPYHKVLQDEQGEEMHIHMWNLPDGSLKALVDKYEVQIVLDGQRAQLRVSDKYRNTARGLCGNFDGNADNDFMTPQHCVLQKPELFSATYAVAQPDTPVVGHIAENKEKARQSSCIQTSYYQTNVINDKEAGRPSTENQQWGYHQNRHQSGNKDGNNRNENNRNGQNHIIYRTKVHENEELCFSLKLVPTCARNTTPTETKMKQIAFHCMPRNEASNKLKSRIEQGANPDMSQKSVSKTLKLEVPIACQFPVY